MDSYEHMLRLREGLVKALAAAGLHDLISVADLAVFGGDERLYADLMQMANDRMLVMQPEIHPFLPGPMPGELPDGDVFVGTVVGTGTELWLPAQLFGEGVGVFGTIGAGKTMTITMLVKQLMEHGIKVWWFDSENEAPGLLRDVVTDGRMLVMGYRDLRRNILEPAPGEQPMEAVGRVAALLRGAMYLRDGSHNLGAEIITRLYSERGIFNGSQEYPCVADVDERLRATRVTNQREGEWLVTLKNRFGDLVRSMGEVYECSRGFPVEQLLEHNIIWGLQGLDQYHHPFVIQDLLSWVIAYRERHRPGRLTHVFVIDEVHRLVSGAEDRFDLGEPLLVGIGRLTRRAGLGLLVADQIPHRLPATLTGNLGTRMVFRLFDGRDVRAMGTSMSLSREQMEYLPQLGPRRAVVHTKLYPRAFLVEMPELQA